MVFIGVESPHARTFRIKHGISHTFSEDAKVLIVENRDTVEADSWLVGLSAEQQKQVIELTIKLLQKAIKLGEKAIDYQIKRKRILLCTCADLTGVSVTLPSEVIGPVCTVNR